MNDDDAVKRALARLDAREDPAPPPEPPPEPEETSRVVMDLRLRVVEHAKGRDRRWSWNVYAGDGSERPSNEIGGILVQCAQLIAMSRGWAQPLWRAAHVVLRAAHECQQIAACTPPPRAS